MEYSNSIYNESSILDRITDTTLRAAVSEFQATVQLISRRSVSLSDLSIYVEAAGDVVELLMRYGSSTTVYPIGSDEEKRFKLDLIQHMIDSTTSTFQTVDAKDGNVVLDRSAQIVDALEASKDLVAMPYDIKKATVNVR